MKLYVVSDLHNEFGQYFDPRLYARAIDPDVIVLPGDIDANTEGIKWARKAFGDNVPIVYVAGNHELYNGYWERTLDDLRQTAREFGVHFLENDAVEINGARFLGCTLWTDFDMFGKKERTRVMERTGAALNDFRLITNDTLQSLYHEVHARPNELVPEHTRLRHLASRAWLEKELACGDPDRTVVVTHHYPSLQSCAPRYRDNPVSAGFGSQLPPQVLARAKLWIHGHTHDSCAYTLWHQEDDAFRETRVVCNPRGYPLRRGSDEFENGRFNPELSIEI
jgi:Icc-related predicted phosphoesterase